ncbi:MAG: hypothetical protein KC912_19190 [Proteobacteria bacterium]|nr:hypothetical protein [Pseudomonadota bacterium]
MRVHWPRPPEGCRVDTMSVEVSTGDLTGSIDVLVTGHPKDGELKAVVDGGAVIVPFAGLSPEARRRLLERPDLRVYNVHANAIDVAELGLALLLALTRRVVPLDQALRDGRWERDSGMRLAGRRVLLLGYGAIGKALAIRLQALGLYMTAIRARGPFGHDQVAEVHPAHALHMLLPSADIVINTLPLVPDTEALLESYELDLLPRGALVLNLGRGETVDETALFEALQSGQVGGAGLDVWWSYDGRPCHHDFEAMDNVVFSPHRGGQVDITEDERAAAVDALLRELMRGDEPDSRVDVERGY